MKKIITLFLLCVIVFSLNLAVIAAFDNDINTQNLCSQCKQCFLKPKDKLPEIIPTPAPTGPQSTAKPKNNQPNANQPNTSRPNANQPNTSQPNTGPSTNQPKANQPKQNLPEANRPMPPKASANPMAALQKRFDALTDAQRTEVYKLTDALTSQFIALTEKYKELGVLTKQEAEQFTSVLKSGYEMAKTSGRILFAFPPVR